MPTTVAGIDKDGAIRLLEKPVRLTTIGEMHDRLIVATALSLSSPVNPVAILTRDEKIRAAGIVSAVR